MAATNPTFIDLVSSDEEGAPPPRARRRGFFGRESRSPSRDVTPDSAPASRRTSLAPAATLRPAMRIPEPAPTPAPAPAHHGDAVAGAELFDVDDPNVIDIDDMIEFDEFFDMPGGFSDDQMPAAPARREPSPARQGQVIVIDGEDIFIPDSPHSARPETSRARRQDILHQDATYAQESANFTVDVCLKRVLAMFPDIDHEHVRQLYHDYDTQGAEALPGGVRLEAIVEKLLSGQDYPRQVKPLLQRKRKREDGPIDQESKRWVGPDREVAGPDFKGVTASILKAEFPEITKTVIANELVANHHLYPTYLALANMKDTSDVNKKWSGRALKDLTSADALAAQCGWPAMPDELEAARTFVKDIRRQRVIQDAKKWAEKENLQRAIDANETAECQACFDNLPMNRQIHCDGDTAHFTCFACATAYVKSEVGDSRCRVLCTAGCGASFARAQLHLLEDKELLEKLEQLQQEKDIRDAGLDNLEECPFCDYKAILPPIEEDFEFRCANELCEKVSCRRCKAVSHIPMSCEEHAKEHKLSSRHKIEEAMTKALIRNCNKCKKGFIKEYGCNKMSCPSCGNLQCYVCSESLKDYNHFDQGPRGLPGAKSSKCPLYDNVEERHEREIKVAEAAARAEVISENPDVSEQDLEIKVSDAVKKATDERVKRAGAVPGGIPPGYGGFGAARVVAGLFMHPGRGHGMRDRANVLEAAALGDGDEDHDDGVDRALLQLQRRRMALEQFEERNAAVRGAANRGIAQNRPARNEAAAPGPNNVLGGADAVGQRALVPRPNGRPPAVPLMLQAMPGGIDEDPFGGWDDDDPYDFHRLMFGPPRPIPEPMPALPVRAPLPRQAAPAYDFLAQRQRVQELQRRVDVLGAMGAMNARLARPQDLQAPPQPIQMQALNGVDHRRQLEGEALRARQRFNDLRRGHRGGFRRDGIDPQRHHGPGGFPEQH